MMQSRRLRHEQPLTLMARGIQAPSASAHPAHNLGTIAANSCQLPYIGTFWLLRCALAVTLRKKIQIQAQNTP